MAISREELAGKLARADHLRSEIRAFRTGDNETRLEAEREVTARQLDDEIKSLEAAMPLEAQSSGGTVADAMAAMERAAQVEEMVVGPKEDRPTDESPRAVVADLAARADAKDGGSQ